MDDFCTEDGIDCGCRNVSVCEATTKINNTQFSFYPEKDKKKSASGKPASNHERNSILKTV